MNEGVVSKETVVLRRWGSSIQKFGFINGVDNVNWPPYRDSTEISSAKNAWLSLPLRISTDLIGKRVLLLQHVLLESQIRKKIKVNIL